MTGSRATESDIALAVLQVAESKPNGTATFDDLRQEIPSYVTLSPEDRVQSPTRPGEEMWEQQIRNIKSHDETFGNIISEGYAEHVQGEGYRITSSGRTHLENLRQGGTI